MTARRPILLSALLLTCVCLVGKLTPAAGQQPDPYRVMTPEEVRAALARIGGLPPDQDPFTEMVRQHLARQGFTNLDPKLLQATIDRFRGDKQMMDQLEKIAREQAKTGRPADPEELAKALRNSGLDKFGPPKGRPGVPPPSKDGPFTRVLPGGGDPRGDGPGGKGPPPDPKSGERPPGPPMGDPPIAQARNRGNGGDPTGQPGAQPRAAEFGNSFSAQDDQRDRTRRTVEALWEKNVGPLDETPTLRRLLSDVVTESGGLTDAAGKNFWDALSRDAGDGGSVGDWFDRGGLGGDWKLSSLDLGSTSMGRWFNGSGPDVGIGDIPSGGSSGGWSAGGGWGFGGLEGSWLPVVLLAAVLFGALVGWRFWYLRNPTRAGWAPSEGLGDWPLDPRRIATRDDLVRAFEYLSVRSCGAEARTWTHGTIAQALTALAATHGETAVLLARLYELARYAPLDEPLGRDDLAEGRDIICQLAGVRTA